MIAVTCERQPTVLDLDLQSQYQPSIDSWPVNDEFN